MIMIIILILLILCVLLMCNVINNSINVVMK